MATVQEYINQRGEELSLQRNDDGQPLYNKEQINGLLKEDLSRRGLSADNVKSGTLPKDSFLNRELPLTVFEHVHKLQADGLTEDQALSDMANRGFYDVRKNIKQYKDRLVPDIIETPEHKRRMETWAQDYEVGSSNTYGYDPYSAPAIQRAMVRKRALEKEQTQGVSAGYLPYLNWLSDKSKAERNARLSTSRGMGNIVGMRRLREVEDREPSVTEEEKNKAEKIFLTRGAMSRAQTEGAATGTGMALLKSVDEMMGSFSPFSRTGLFEEDEQTRYNRIPILDKNGRIVKNKKTGKPKYRLEESPEEMLKFGLENHTRLMRVHLNEIARLRNSGNLTTFGKGKEELWDLVQGGMMLSQVFIPLLDNLTAGAIAAEENKANDPRFDSDDLLFQQKLQGFQNVQGLAGNMHAYFKPLMDSLVLTTGMAGPQILTEDQLKTPEGEQYVDIPLVGKVSTPTLTNEMKEQFKAFPLDGLLSVLSVTKFLSGLGSKASLAFHNKAVRRLTKAGVSPEVIAKFEENGLSKLYSNSQKSYLRRIVESSVGVQADNAVANAFPSALRKAAGPLADVASAAGKGFLVGDAVGGVPGEGAILAAGAGGLSAVSQLIKNVPALKRQLTPEIHASQNPYSDKWSGIAADRVARDQNLVDAAETGGEFQIQSGDRVNLENLPAHTMDNVARVTARVDLDPEVIAAKEALDSLDTKAPGYAAALDEFDELRTRKFNEVAEAELPYELRESGAHDRITDLNRRRNRINETADRLEAEVVDNARVSMSQAARDASRSTDLDGDIARVDSELRELDSAEAARDVRLNEEVNRLEQVNDQKQRDAYIGRTAEDQIDSVRQQKQKAATLEYEDGVAALERQAAEAAAVTSTRRIELQARRAVAEEQIRLRQKEAQDAALFAEGLIDADEFAARRAEVPEVSAVEVHAKNLSDELKKVNAGRNRRLQRNLDDHRSVLEAMRSEYATTLRFRAGQLNPDQLVQGMRNHVFFDASGNVDFMKKEFVPDSINRPGGGPGVVTFESPGPQASPIAKRLEQLPVEQQIPILSSLEDAALRLAEAGGGITSRRFRGGGKNALYRFYYETLASHIFSEVSPRLLRSPTMRKKFARYVIREAGKELGIKNTPQTIRSLEGMINDMASPRHYGGDYFVEPAYSIYKNGQAVADLGDLFTRFAIKELDPKELRRVALEALQTELPMLQARVGANTAASVALEASGTTLDALRKGPGSTKKKANIGYIASVASVFKKEGSLPIVVNLGFPESVKELAQFPSGGQRPALQVLVASDPAAKNATLKALGELDNYNAGGSTPKYDALVSALEELSQRKTKEWVSINNAELGLKLPETELVGAGVAPDPSPGLKTLHPAVEARNLRSPASRLTEVGQSGGGNVVVHKDFANTIGWVLDTSNQLGDSNSVLNAIINMTKGYTSLWKLTKTGLNPINLSTNGISNFFTLMLSEGLDPLTTLRVIRRGAVDMFTYRYDPKALSVVQRQRMEALLRTGGINNTVLVKEVDNIFRELAKDGFKGKEAVNIIHGLITGRSMDGVPFGSGSPIKGSRLGEGAANLSTAAQRRYSDVMRKAYRALGDELFKYTKASLEMDKNANKFAKMRNGSAEVFFDIAKGAYDQSPKMGTVVKLGNGDMLIKRSDGSTVTGTADSPKVTKELNQFNADVSMSSANSYYYNLSDLGKLLSGLRHVEGLIPMFPTFLSWMAKSFDIPFIKKGLFYRTMIDDIYSISSDPAINSKILSDATARSIRRNLLMLGMRKREMDNDDLRRLLPKWLAGGAIYGDLSSIVSNNQIPWSGYLDVLGLADDLTRRASAAMDPKFAAEVRLFDELGDNSKGGNNVMPIVDFAKATLGGIDPYTGVKFEGGRFSADYWRSVFMQIGGGLINAPRKAFELFAETEGVVTYKELKGLSREDIQKRQLLSGQQRSVAVVNALMFNRYRHINPEVTLQKVMKFPAQYKKRIRKEILDEWKIDIFDKSFDPDNPLAYFQTKKGQQASLDKTNFENLEAKLDSYQEFLGEDGAWYHVSDRIMENMMSRMTKVDAKRFGKLFNQLKSNDTTWSNLKPSREWKEHLDNQQSYGDLK